MYFFAVLSAIVMSSGINIARKEGYGGLHLIPVRGDVHNFRKSRTEHLGVRGTSF